MTSMVSTESLQQFYSVYSVYNIYRDFQSLLMFSFHNALYFKVQNMGTAMFYALWSDFSQKLLIRSKQVLKEQCLLRLY